MEFLKANSDIVITGYHAQVIRRMVDGQVQMFSESPIELLYLAAFIGFIFDIRSNTKPEPESEFKVEISRTQFPRFDNRFLMQFRTFLLNKDHSPSRETTAKVFRMPGDEAERSTFFSEWFSYALGGLEIIEKELLGEHSENYYDNIEKWGKLLSILDEILNNDSNSQIDGILSGK